MLLRWAHIDYWTDSVLIPYGCPANCDSYLAQFCGWCVCEALWRPWVHRVSRYNSYVLTEMLINSAFICKKAAGTHHAPPEVHLTIQAYPTLLLPWEICMIQIHWLFPSSWTKFLLVVLNTLRDPDRLSLLLCCLLRPKLMWACSRFYFENSPHPGLAGCWQVPGFLFDSFSLISLIRESSHV